MSDYHSISSRALRPSQRGAMRRVLRFYRERNRYSGCTSVRFRLERSDSGVVSLTLCTRRSDCEPASPRAVLCQERAHVFIGPRGGLRLVTADCGLDSNRRSHTMHVARMLRATVPGYVRRNLRRD